jgi:hypothetical protein
MATCPKGHESTTVDYCDECGAALAGATPAVVPPPPTVVPSPSSPSSPAPPAEPCPVCGAPKTGRFCEEDGYDFLLAPPVSAPAVSVPAPAVAWQVVVRADPAYFEVVKAMGGEDAGTLAFPRFVAERRFELTGAQLVIGRRSRSRGVNPDIDLVGPPEDPGVSHLHALLVAQPSGWAVVDLDSANGTYLNDPAAPPITPNAPMPLKDGDTVYLGAWTTLSVLRASPR